MSMMPERPAECLVVMLGSFIAANDACNKAKSHWYRCVAVLVKININYTCIEKLSQVDVHMSSFPLFFFFFKQASGNLFVH